MPPPTELRTANLLLRPSTLALTRAEMQGHDTLAAALGAEVPQNWPPENLNEALPWYLEQFERNPDLSGWLNWYALLVAPQAVLIGGLGFKGPPFDSGYGEPPPNLDAGDSQYELKATTTPAWAGHCDCLEIGYSLLPQFQHRGFATEMTGALVAWAFSHPNVRRITAEIATNNPASMRVLLKHNFRPYGIAKDPNHIRWELDR